MMMGRGKRVAAFTGIFGLALLGIFAFRSRGALYEEWLICRLSSSNREARNAAAGKLAELECLKAVPRIIDLIRGDDQERLEWKVESPKWVRYLTPLLHSLHRMGAGARDQLEEALREERKRLGSNDGSGAEEASPTWFLGQSRTPVAAVIVHPHDRSQRPYLYLREVILSWKYDFIETRKAD
jgi:hypothetical protein